MILKDIISQSQSWTSILSMKAEIQRAIQAHIIAKIFESILQCILWDVFVSSLLFGTSFMDLKRTMRRSPARNGACIMHLSPSLPSTVHKRPDIGRATS